MAADRARARHLSLLGLVMTFKREGRRASTCRIRRTARMSVSAPTLRRPTAVTVVVLGVAKVIEEHIRELFEVW